MCKRFFNDSGVTDNLIIFDLELDLIPLDEDVISLNQSNFFKNVFIDGDYTFLHEIARSLAKFELKYGIISKIYGKGKHAQVSSFLISSLSVTC